MKPNESSTAATAAIPEDGEEEEGRAGACLDKRFGFGKGFEKNFEMGEEVGRGHFGYTCLAKFRKGELKGEKVAVKVIPKAKVTKSFHLFFVSLTFQFKNEFFFFVFLIFIFFFVFLLNWV